MKRNFRNLWRTSREGIEKELQHIQEKKISDDERKNSISNLAESVESEEISASSSEWKKSLDKLFVTCLNNSENIAKPIKNWLDLFINTSLKHMSIWDLVRQPNKK